MRVTTASIFLDLMKGIMSRLTILSPNDSVVTFGVTCHWIPSLDLPVVIIISSNVVLSVKVTPSTTLPLSTHWPLLTTPAVAPFATWTVCDVIFTLSAWGIWSKAIFPKFLEVSSLHVLETVSDTQSVSQAPQSTSLNPVWTSIPNSATAASYSLVFSITFASKRFVSVQVSESGFKVILPL